MCAGRMQLHLLRRISTSHSQTFGQEVNGLASFNDVTFRKMREVDHSPQQKKQHILGDKLGSSFSIPIQRHQLAGPIQHFKKLLCAVANCFYFQLLGFNINMPYLFSWYYILEVLTF